MNWYAACNFCAVNGDRAKALPFGNLEGKVLFVIPGYLRLDEDAQKEYASRYPEALFVSFAACAGVEDVQQAERLCAVLLRNSARTFYKVMISDYDPLKKLFGVTSESTTKEDGTQIVVYRGQPLDKSAQEEYKRLLNG